MASQRQRVPKMGEAKRRLFENRLHRFGVQEMEDVSQRKAVLLGQGDVQAVVGGGSLQFKIEAAAEALAQRQAPGFVDATAEGRVDDQLHSAALVEKSLRDDGVLSGNISQHRASLQDVLDRLLGAGIVQPALFFQPGDSLRHCGLALRDSNWENVVQAIADFLSQVGNMGGKLLGSRRSLAPPEGDGGRSAMSIFDQHTARLAFHAADAPGGVAEQHDVAGHALDGEVFVQRAHDNSVRFGHHREQCGLRDGAAAGDGGQPAAAPRPQFAVHAVAMDVGAVAAAPRCNSLGKHFENGVVSFAGQIAVGISPRHQRE